MCHIEQIRSYLSDRRGANYVRVLLICGGQFSNALGDTTNFAFHLRYLSSALGPIAPTIWTADATLWTALCGNGVYCTPFLDRDDVVHRYQLVLFDWVNVDPSVETLFSESQAVLIDFGRSGAAMRYRLGSGLWQRVEVPPKVNNVLRLEQAYLALGVPEHSLHRARAKLDSVGRTPSARRVYVNPYGSIPNKCIHPELFFAIIRALAGRLHGQSVEIQCPTLPRQLLTGDNSTFQELSAIAQRCAEDHMVTLLPPLTVSEYVTHVRDSALVIGPDTSSQHLANYYGVTSIACYPWHTGYRYFYWGCPGPRNFCFRAPDAKLPNDCIAFASLVAFLSDCLLRPTSVEGYPDAPVCKSYKELCCAIANGNPSSSGRALALKRCIADMEQLVPSEWKHFLFPELLKLADEICDPVVGESGARRPVELAMVRITDIYSLKVINVLASETTDNVVPIDTEDRLSRDARDIL